MLSITFLSNRAHACLVYQLNVKYIDLQLRTSIFSVDTQKVISKKFKKASIIDLCVTDVIRVC